MVKVRDFNTLVIVALMCSGSLPRLCRLADGEWSDDDIKDPLSDMVMLLTEKRDRTLTQEWGIWLTKRDPERGLKVWEECLATLCGLLMIYFCLWFC